MKRSDKVALLAKMARIREEKRQQLESARLRQNLVARLTTISKEHRSQRTRAAAKQALWLYYNQPEVTRKPRPPMTIMQLD